VAGDDVSSRDKHIEALGLSPEFTLEEAEVVLKDLDERLAETIARRKAIEEQRRKKREEVARLRRGRVLADHGDDGGDDEDLLVWKWVPVC
jgi:hypothetical protein